MSEELQKQIAQYLERLEQAVESGSALAQEQIPLLVQELINWYWWAHLLWLMVLVGLMVLSVSVSGWCFRLSLKNARDEETYIPLMVMFLGITLGTFMGVDWNAVCLIKVSVAPRLVALEQIRGLLP